MTTAITENPQSSPPNDRQVSRRTLAKGTLWSAPVIISTATAPVFAASLPLCTYKVGTWAASGGTSGSMGGVPYAITRTSTTTLLSTNNTPEPASDFGLGGYKCPTGMAAWANCTDWLRLDQESKGGPASQTLTFTFPQPVYCLEFYIHDIDSNQESNLIGGFTYRDSVTVGVNNGGSVRITPPAPVVRADRSTGSEVAVTGNGTSSAQAMWWRAEQFAGSNIGYGSNRGTINVQVSGPGITSMTLTYENKNYVVGLFPRPGRQQIFISEMRYSVNPCQCSVPNYP